MDKKKISNIVMQLFLYADMCKMIHYTTEKMHGHKLADDVRDLIMDFADDLAEKSFGMTGKPSFEDFSLKLSIKKSEDISVLCQNVLAMIDSLRDEIKSDDKYSGIVSIIDDFKADLSQKVYLAMFDNVSDKKLDEAVKRVVRDMLR